jgi:hypothetical protein
MTKILSVSVFMFIVVAVCSPKQFEGLRDELAKVKE